MKEQDHSKTILVVDDDASTLKLLSTALSNNGFEVLEASCGCEGISTLADNPVDLVITDWKMPNMSGLNLLQNIREKQELRHLPVLMVSASESPAAIERAYELGVYYWLKKPFGFKMLVRVINDALKEN